MILEVPSNLVFYDSMTMTENMQLSKHIKYCQV